MHDINKKDNSDIINGFKTCSPPKIDENSNISWIYMIELFSRLSCSGCIKKTERWVHGT